MTWTWAWVAWAVIVTLWAGVLLMKPWKQLTWASNRKFLLWPVLWLLLTAASMPFYYSLETTGYPIVIPATTVFVASGLNLMVLFWLLLLTKGEFWQTRPLALCLLRSCAHPPDDHGGLLSRCRISPARALYH